MEKINEEEFVEDININNEEEQGEQRNYRRQRDGKRQANRDNRDNRDNRTRDDKDDFRQRRMRRKVCLLCKEKNYYLDYKDAETMRRFINEKGKILPRRATGTCARHQREIAKVIKRGRHIGVLPYTTD